MMMIMMMTMTVMVVVTTIRKVVLRPAWTDCYDHRHHSLVE